MIVLDQQLQATLLLLLFSLIFFPRDSIGWVQQFRHSTSVLSTMAERERHFGYRDRLCRPAETSCSSARPSENHRPKKSPLIRFMAPEDGKEITQTTTNSKTALESAKSFCFGCILLFSAWGAASSSSLALTSPSVAVAYERTDFGGDAVQSVIQLLRDSSGDPTKIQSAYEEVAAIIIEGKGVGGQINYKGVQLERGFVADEDTTIYNPGLSLLTESEKEKLVEAIVDARKSALVSSQSVEWTENNELGFTFLREKLDPYHTFELAGYLKVLPVLTAVVYVAVLAVQQFFRDLFAVAYFVGVAVVVVPALFLIAVGP